MNCTGGWGSSNLPTQYTAERSLGSVLMPQTRLSPAGGTLSLDLAEIDNIRKNCVHSLSLAGFLSTAAAILSPPLVCSMHLSCEGGRERKGGWVAHNCPCSGRAQILGLFLSTALWDSTFLALCLGHSRTWMWSVPHL